MNKGYIVELRVKQAASCGLVALVGMVYLKKVFRLEDERMCCKTHMIGLV